jgi:hypothetical protein
MPTTTNPLVQLVTRIPYDLRRRVKIHCTRTDVTLTRFVIEALVERLETEDRRAGVVARRAASR